MVRRSRSAVTPSPTRNVARIAVSQAAPLRRLHVKGELHLVAFDKKWNAGWASGGILADSVVDGKVPLTFSPCLPATALGFLRHFWYTSRSLSWRAADGRPDNGRANRGGRHHLQLSLRGGGAGARVDGEEPQDRERWADFRVPRDGSDIGTLLELRSQYKGKEQAGKGQGDAAAVPGRGQDAATPEPAENVGNVAMDQLKPPRRLLPELTPSAAKATISLYAGKLVVAYAHPRKRGLPRFRVFMGDNCPEWATPDPTYAAWCFVDDWPGNVERVVALGKEAPRRRAEDLAAGRDPYRRREEKAGEAPTGEG